MFIENTVISELTSFIFFINLDVFWFSSKFNASVLLMLIMEFQHKTLIAMSTVGGSTTTKSTRVVARHLHLILLIIPPTAVIPTITTIISLIIISILILFIFVIVSLGFLSFGRASSRFHWFVATEALKAFLSVWAGWAAFGAFIATVVFFVVEFPFTTTIIFGSGFWWIFWFGIFGRVFDAFECFEVKVVRILFIFAEHEFSDFFVRFKLF